MPTPTLVSTQVAILFQLGSPAADSPVSDEESDRRYEVYKSAHLDISKQFRELPGLSYSDGEMTIYAYEPCEFDGTQIEFHGKLAEGVWFAAAQALSVEQVTELKALCIKCFTAAGAAAGIPCTFVGIQAHNEYNLTEVLDLEVA